MGRITGIVISLFLLATSLTGQTINTEFGKNRIQYHDDFSKWDMYETENFVTYWYGKGREIAHTVVQMAEMDNPYIQNILEHKMNDKIELIVYLDLTDMKQSNLGMEEQFTGKGGVTKVIENKVFLYYNGDHNDLRRQLRQGIAAVYINAMLHGNSLQEIVQNAVLLSLGDWFQDGLVSYVAEEWNPELENRLNDYFTNPKGKKKDFKRLAKENPQLAGHSMWYFMANTYGRATISNILYLTRIQRSLESGLIYVLGFGTKELMAQWKDYYLKRIEASASPSPAFTHDLNLTIQKKPLMIGRMRLSPDGQQLAYTLHNLGRVRVYLYDMKTGEKKVLLRYGIRNFEVETDFNYPILAWSPDGQKLSILYERRDLVSLMTIDFDEHMSITDKLSPEYQRVYDMDYWAADTLMFAATTDGLADLYLYAPEQRQSVRLTDDFYDDLDASVVNITDHRYILFSSNRPDENLRKMQLDSILPIGQFDLFLMDVNKSKSTLRKLTFSPDASERKSRIAGEDEIIALADYKGQWQRILISDIMEDPPLSMLHTRYDRDIILHEIVPQSPVVIDWLEKWNKPYIHISALDSTRTLSNLPVDQPSMDILVKEEKEAPVKPQQEEIDPKYFFQTPFPVVPKQKTEPIVVQPTIKAETPALDISKILQPSASGKLEYNPGDLTPFIRSRIIASRLKFKLDYFNVTLDNDLLFGGLDSYAGTKREFEPSPMGILFKASITDLFEDYVVTGGIRFPTSFNGSEYFLVFDNRKKRIDKEFAVYRKSRTEPDYSSPDPSHQNQYVTFLALSKWSYPFDTYNSVRGTLTFRNDKTIPLAVDKQTLDAKTDDAQRLGLKMEWVYDNTRLLDMNSRLGTRIKSYVEVVKKFDLNLFESDEKFQFDKGFMTVLGLDARHYVSLDDKSILALRVTGATTLGSERILYYLGGVENWMFPQYDQGTMEPTDVNFAYTALGANMRGFKYNARNGSSILLTNAEFRVPLFQYLSKAKIRSSFIRNLQVVGFVDAGSAWHGSNPFGTGNPLNTVVLTNPPTVEVTVNYYRNPLIVGYGFGARTLIFGYFLKLDYGWNWESGTDQKPILHFSMGTDF
jgi:hypothetical protein